MGNRSSQKPDNVENDDIAEDELQADMVILELDSRGRLYAKSQVTDYVFRGDELSDYNVVRYFTDTYERAEHVDDHPKGKAGMLNVILG